jgi:hypothetical protein
VVAGYLIDAAFDPILGKRQILIEDGFIGEIAMSTQTQSRVLLSVLISPAVALALYWIFGNAPIWGWLVMLGVIVAYVFIWRPRPAEKKAS